MSSASPRRSRAIVLPSAAHAATLTAVLVAGLYFGRSVLVPLALAVLLSFVLSPLVLAVRKTHAPRPVAVAIVVMCVVVAVAGLGMIMARQVTDLAGELPRYETTLREKLRSLRTGSAQTSVIDRATATLKVLGKELDQASQGAAPTSGNPDRGRPIPVEIRQPPERPLDTYQRIATALLAPVTTTGIVLLLIIFILLQREDIRDRVIRLVGAGDIESTTTALNDAAFRLSRLFLAQTALNATFGVVIGLGLWLIGVPNPFLWGIIAALMRFIPYIGALLAAIFPILLAAAVDPGWSMALWTLALYLTVEPIVGHLIEPWLQGQTTGLSPLAIVVSAILWTALWGPIGLLLATPLTMCLVVLGRHVEGLAFLDIILGDEPALSPPEVFYQRMLAGTTAEAAEHAQQVLKKSSLLDYYDDVALAGLRLAAQDVQRGLLDEERIDAVKDGVALLLDDLSDHPLEPTQKTNSEAVNENGDGSAVKQPSMTVASMEMRPDWRDAPSPVLCLAARSIVDASASDILAQVLQRHGIGSQSTSVSRLGDVRGLALSDVRVVWISSINAAQAHAQIRYIIRRLKRSAPDVILCGGFWDGVMTADMAKSIGVTYKAATLADALTITSRLARGHSVDDAELIATEGAPARHRAHARPPNAIEDRGAGPVPS